MWETQTLVAERHAALRALYQRQPDAALIVKRVRTRPPIDHEPSHSTTEPENLAHPDAPYGVSWQLGLDEAVGGLQDGPNPGEMLCASLAACQEGLLRMMAASLRVELEEVDVTVTGRVDVRGTLALDPAVRVGFQMMRLEVRLRAAPGTPTRLLERLRIGAEQLCVTLDTLRNGVRVEASYDLATG